MNRSPARERGKSTLKRTREDESDNEDELGEPAPKLLKLASSDGWLLRSYLLQTDLIFSASPHRRLPPETPAEQEPVRRTT
jgi:hypothetical protein